MNHVRIGERKSRAHFNKEYSLLYSIEQMGNLMLFFIFYTEGHYKTSAGLLGRDAHPNQR